MKFDKNYTQIAANNFMDALKNSDSIAYEIVMRSVSIGDVVDNMQGMGQNEDVSIWDSISAGINNIVKTGVGIYKDKKTAEHAAQLAKDQARNALLAVETQIELEKTAAETAERQAELERTRFIIQREKAKVDRVLGVELSPQNLVLLGVAAVGMFMLARGRF